MISVHDEYLTGTKSAFEYINLLINNQPTKECLEKLKNEPTSLELIASMSFQYHKFIEPLRKQLMEIDVEELKTLDSTIKKTFEEIILHLDDTDELIIKLDKVIPNTERIKFKVAACAAFHQVPNILLDLTKNELLRGKYPRLIFYEQNTLPYLLEKDKDFVNQLSQIDYSEETIERCLYFKEMAKILPYSKTTPKTIKIDNDGAIQDDFLAIVKQMGFKIDMSHVARISDAKKEQIVKHKLYENFVLNREQKEDLLQYVKNKYDAHIEKEAIRALCKTKSTITRKII
jgi:hypothetical protein